MAGPLHIDGRRGEGGGQILRSSLALAIATGRAIEVEHIRAGRKKSGLLRQHLAGVRAAAEISGGDVLGAELGSGAIAFAPGPVRAGSYRFAVGSAGSALLVLQTILVPLVLADGESEVVIQGGTHNPSAPPFDCLRESFLPQLAKIGAHVELELVRAGFVPAGGGEIVARIAPVSSPKPLVLLDRGPETERGVEILTAHLPEDIAAKQARLVRSKLPLMGDQVRHVEVPESLGPGNVVTARLGYRDVTEVLTSFGRRNFPSKRVVDELKREVHRYLASDAPVGEHLADQLLLPMALLAGGRFRTLRPSRHTTTNAAVLDAFLGSGTVQLSELARDSWLVEVAAPGAA